MALETSLLICLISLGANGVPHLRKTLTSHPVAFECLRNMFGIQRWQFWSGHLIPSPMVQQFWQLKAKSKPKDFKIRSTTIPKNYFERSWMFIFGPKSTQITTQLITLGSSPKSQNSSKGRVVEIVTVIFSTWWFGANHRLGKQFPGRPKCPKIVFRYPETVR